MYKLTFMGLTLVLENGNTISPPCSTSESCNSKQFSRTDKEGILGSFMDNFGYFSIKTYVVGTH